MSKTLTAQESLLQGSLASASRNLDELWGGLHGCVWKGHGAMLAAKDKNPGDEDGWEILKLRDFQQQTCS